MGPPGGRAARSLCSDKGRRDPGGGAGIPSPGRGGRLHRRAGEAGVVAQPLAAECIESETFYGCQGTP